MRKLSIRAQSESTFTRNVINIYTTRSRVERVLRYNSSLRYLQKPLCLT